MSRIEFIVLNSFRSKTNGSFAVIAKESGLALNRVVATYKKLVKQKLIKDNKITSLGLKALLPYKVNNAIIMAAGMSSRFVPLSFEKPKGLLKVKGEVLIERQINQLIEVGIKNIILVVGYKKEDFLYLKNKYSFIKIIDNPSYSKKNNIETLYVARKYLDNSYICSVDDYFTSNPFDLYVYEAYYAGHYAKEKTDEFYMVLNKQGYIKRIYIGGKKANIMFGHAYFDKRFSKAFASLMEYHHKTGDYDQYLWDVMLMKNLNKLPPMYGKLYPYGLINEFDSLEDLRKFDHKFINHTGSNVIKKICQTLKCQEREITDFKMIKENLPAYSFSFKFKKKKYVYSRNADNKITIR